MVPFQRCSFTSECPIIVPGHLPSMLTTSWITMTFINCTSAHRAFSSFAISLRFNRHKMKLRPIRNRRRRKEPLFNRAQKVELCPTHNRETQTYNQGKRRLKSLRNCTWWSKSTGHTIFTSLNVSAAPYSWCFISGYVRIAAATIPILTETYRLGNKSSRMWWNFLKGSRGS